jgi:hypothetical protein
VNSRLIFFQIAAEIGPRRGVLAPHLGARAARVLYNEFRRLAPRSLATGYPVIVSDVEDENRAACAGLCARCRFMRQIKSDRGSTFYLCERSATDAAFPKYPRLPVLECEGYEPQVNMQDSPHE